MIASGRADFSLAGGFASNGYGAHSPGGYSLAAGLVSEVVMTFMFLIVILGTTHTRAPVGFAGLAIGLALTLIHLISIPVTNTSVNPARSTATAVFVGGWALQQLWLFWLAPVIGAAIAGFVYSGVFESSVKEPQVTGRYSFLTRFHHRESNHEVAHGIPKPLRVGLGQEATAQFLARPSVSVSSGDSSRRGRSSRSARCRALPERRHERASRLRLQHRQRQVGDKA